MVSRSLRGGLAEPCGAVSQPTAAQSSAVSDTQTENPEPASIVSTTE
jgi:hypothetical protein